MNNRAFYVGGLALICAAFEVPALEVQVSDQKGAPLSGAVVAVISRDGEPLLADAATDQMIDQRDKEFIPYMTAVTVGSQVRFPNNDKIRHQVYSFSDAKSFEIPLYSGAPAEPVTFDKTGVVTLGCNIHDWMQAYVFVSQTPFYAVTNTSGRATIEGLDTATYAVQVWHPTLKGDVAATTQEVSTADSAQLVFSLPTKKVWHAFRSPTGMGLGGYK